MSFRRQLTELVKCSICLSQLEDPRVLPCLHTYCRGCLETLARETQGYLVVTCPECREIHVISDVSELRTNFFVNNLISVLVSHHEVVCERNGNPAQRQREEETCDAGKATWKHGLAIGVILIVATLVSVVTILTFKSSQDNPNGFIRRERSTCKNFKGSYICTCNAGFTGEGQNCTDIDECASDTDKCSAHGICTNTFGSYECSCKKGFTGDGFTCRDVNECKTGSHVCDANAVCLNTEGSFNCACKTGYHGNGRHCSDDNECLLGTDDCSPHATCLNLIGSFNCTCNHGYTGNGKTCNDVNECALGLDKCGAHSTCANTAGSYRCDCHTGYEKTGSEYSCSNVNECKLTHPCHEDAICTDTVGSYRCSCKQGFQGDGQDYCNDIDECSSPCPRPCSLHASCVNTPGSYTCECRDGYHGNGFSCKASGNNVVTSSKTVTTLMVLVAVATGWWRTS